MSEYKQIEGDDSVTDARIGIVASKFNSFVVERLLDGCLAELRKAGFNEDCITIVHVPGAFEIPVAAQRLINTEKFDAVIALGAIIRGETPHFEYIANECSHGLATIALTHETPVIFGVLTTDNSEQAMDRAGSEESNKGAEAAKAAIEMISVFRKIIP